MDALVLVKLVPDVVEELEVGPDGCSLDTQWLRMIVSECSEHALEQALLLKEIHGGKVTVAAFDAPEVDEALFTALAKGADRAFKLDADGPESRSPLQAARLAELARAEAGVLGPDSLIFCGSQAIDDLEGEVGAFLAAQLGLPYVGVVTNVVIDPSMKKITAIKEFASGVRGAFELTMPAVLGIQAAASPPRYVPVAKIRAAMKSGEIETRTASAPAPWSAPTAEALFKPETSGHARMLEGSPEAIADQLAELLEHQGLI